MFAFNHALVLMCFQGTLLLGVGVFTLCGTLGKFATRPTFDTLFVCDRAANSRLAHRVSGLTIKERILSRDEVRDMITR